MPPFLAKMFWAQPVAGAVAAAAIIAVIIMASFIFIVCPPLYIFCVLNHIKKILEYTYFTDLYEKYEYLFLEYKFILIIVVIPLAVNTLI